MLRTSRRVIASLALTALTSTLAFAYSVQPMIYTLTPSGARSTARITVTNTRAEVLNVELQPFSVTVDEAGKRAFTLAPNDFLIFPPQASIAGDKSQLMQVRYVGAPTMDKGKVFVLRVKQTNSTEMVKQDAAAAMQSHLAMSLNFNTTAIVQPDSLKPALAMTGDLVLGKDGALHGRMTNSGAGVADLTLYSWQLKRGDKVEPLALDQIRYGDAVFVMPGASREMSLVDTIKGPAQLIIGALPEERGGRGL